MGDKSRGMRSTPTAMTGAMLQAEIDTYGIDAETLARRLNMSLRTIIQYLKPSHVPRREFVQRVRDELCQIHLESLEILATKNRTQFSTTRLSLYHEALPSVAPIENLPASRIFRRRPEQGSFPEFARAQSWEDWREHAAFDRAKAVYRRVSEGQSFMSGGHATVLMGNPGAGKTTEMKRLLLYLQDQGMSCVFVPLSVYNQEEMEDLFGAARLFYVDRLHLRLPMEFIKLLQKEIAEQRLVFLLDSLDEVDLPKRRNSIVHQINDLGNPPQAVPVFISSRYVQPRLDHDTETAMGNAPRYHLAGLDPAQVVGHVDMLRNYLSDTVSGFSGLGPRSLLPLLGDYIKKLDALIVHLRYLENSLSSNGSSDVPAYTMTERARRTFAGMALPLFLHLYISLCLERDIPEWSIDSIISRYVEFLLGKWTDSRSENPVQGHQGQASLERALAYLGFELCLREHMGRENPTPAEVERLLVDYRRAMDQASSTDEKLTAFVKEQIHRAQTAQIFAPDSPEHLRFSAPADVLRDYHVARFIEQSTAVSEANNSRSRSYTPPSEEFPPIADATYSQFLINPNLRFLERGHVLYFQSLFENQRVLSLQARIRFDEARAVPPVQPDLFGCNREQLDQIIPLNLIFLGKALAGDLTDQYKELHAQLRDDLDHRIFRRTHFAPVYKALRGIILPLRERLDRPMSEQDYSEMIERLDPDSEDDLKKMDELWRGAPNARFLIRLTRRVQGNPIFWESNSKQRLLRRIAYEFRYHAATFDEEAGNLLEELHKRAWPTGRDMLMATQRILRTTYNSQKWSGSEWCGYFDKAEREEQEYLKKQKEDLMRFWVDRLDRGRTERFVHRVVEEKNLSFVALQRASSYLREVVTSPEFNLQDGVAALGSLLGNFRAGTVGDNTREKDEAESKIYIFLCQIADTFWGQQLLMPEDYQLRSLRRKPARDLRIRPEAILQKLFETVRKHLPSDNNDKAAGTANAAGLQPYDFAVEAIWAILYGPNSRDAREEVEP